MIADGAHHPSIFLQEGNDVISSKHYVPGVNRIAFALFYEWDVNEYDAIRICFLTHRNYDHYYYYYHYYGDEGCNRVDNTWFQHDPILF